MGIEEKQWDYEEMDTGTSNMIIKRYEMARKQRVAKRTRFNPVSSRGHAVFEVRKTRGNQVLCTWALGDLAGYESPELTIVGIPLKGGGNLIPEEGKALVKGIVLVGDFLEDLAASNFADLQTTSKNKKMLKLLSLYFDHGWKFEMAIFVVCVNTCGPNQGRLEDTWNAIEIGAGAANVVLEVQEIKEVKKVVNKQENKNTDTGPKDGKLIPEFCRAEWKMTNPPKTQRNIFADYYVDVSAYCCQGEWMNPPHNSRKKNCCGKDRNTKADIYTFIKQEWLSNKCKGKYAKDYQKCWDENTKKAEASTTSALNNDWCPRSCGCALGPETKIWPIPARK